MGRVFLGFTWTFCVDVCKTQIQSFSQLVSGIDNWFKYASLSFCRRVTLGLEPRQMERSKVKSCEWERKRKKHENRKDTLYASMGQLGLCMPYIILSKQLVENDYEMVCVIWIDSETENVWIWKYFSNIWIYRSLIHILFIVISLIMQAADRTERSRNTF